MKNGAGSILSENFYRREDVVAISRELIGKVLCTRIDGVLSAGKIVETEAYCGRDDAACHAHMGRFTERTKTMYMPGGTAYIYLCYGIHHLFNVVTNEEGNADAVLIRALEPVDGVEKMLERREMEKVEKRLTSGPGCLSQALGIRKELDGSAITQPDSIWIEDRGFTVNDSEIVASPRIGVNYAGADADLPWRHSLNGSRWVSTRPRDLQAQ